MSTKPPSPVSLQTERALREAMERLFAGRPERTDGRLTKNNLWQEAGVSRATMNRASTVLAEWDALAAMSPAGALQQKRNNELAELRGRLRRSREECHQLRDQVDAAATVIMTLLAENAALREQAVRRSAVIVPISRSVADRP